MLCMCVCACVRVSCWVVQRRFCLMCIAYSYLCVPFHQCALCLLHLFTSRVPPLEPVKSSGMSNESRNVLMITFEDSVEPVKLCVCVCVCVCVYIC